MRNSIATYQPNYAIYPTGVYKKYNKYLIEEYSKLPPIFGKEKHLREVEYLLESNSDTSNSIKALNVIDWEEHLIEYYKILDTYLKSNNLSRLKTIESFLRKEKLQRINNLNK